MSNFTQVNVRGLSTYNSDLTNNQPNYLADCNNIVINKDNVAETRRGNKIYGNAMGTSPSADNAHQLLIYKKRLLRHFGTGSGTTLQYDNGTGTFTSFFGTYAEVDQGLRIKSIESNGNFYFTTNKGIKKISAASASQLNASSGYITDSGGVKALDLNGNIDYSQAGFFTQDSVVAYRIVWGIKDANQNLILGVPSNRLVLKNSLGTLLINDVNRLLAGLDRAAAADNGDGLSDTDYLSLLKTSPNASAQDIHTNLDTLCTKLDVDMGGTAYATLASTYPNPSANPTSAELVNLQEFYDAIVDALLAEPIIRISVAGQAAGDFQNSTQSSIADLQFTIPSEITTDAYFYQIYRTAVTQSTGVGILDDLDPGDEMGLVYEANTTSAERALGFIDYQDIVPESFRGANLYTNPQSGEGILQANEIPPIAKDVASFKNSVFYANTTTKHRLSISLLGVNNFISGTTKISISDGTVINTYTFVSPVSQVVTVTHVAGASYTSTGSSDYFDIFSANNKTDYRVWFQAGTSVAPAVTTQTLVQVTVDIADSATQVATKTYNALNLYNDFFMVAPGTGVLTVGNTVAAVANAPTENVADPGFSVAVVTPGEGEDASQLKVLLSALPTPAQQVDETARSLVRVINENSGEIINAFYLSGPSDVPGSMLFEGRDISTLKFYVLSDSTATGSSFNPDIAPSNTITNISAAAASVITSASHGLTTGDQIYILNSNSTPSIDGIFAVTVLSSNTFSIPVNVTVAGTTGVFKSFASIVSSDNEVSPNRIYFSKFQQPEAVPLVNYFDVGPKDTPVQRIVPLRDSLFVLKEEGIYRVSGDSAISGFSQALFDSSAIIQAPDSAVVLNNQIFMFSNQGVAVISDTGVNIISRPIENLLLPLVQYPNFIPATFGVSYESDRSYLIWTVTELEDTDATQCFRYNTFTNNWTKWEISKTCGIVFGDKLYLGAADTNFIEQERKNFNRTDYADRELPKTIGNNAVSGDVVSLGSVSDVRVGDILFQDQSLTTYEFNQLLTKLDTDPTVDEDDYLATLEAANGSNLRDKLTSLATKLDADVGLQDSTYAAAISGFGSTFIDQQNAFNVIVGKLNVDDGASFNNYPTSTDTVMYEAIITAIDKSLLTITISPTLPIIAGSASIFQHIPFSLQWNPQFFGDSELFKQVSETKFIFERTNFTTATVSYSSDVSPAFEEQEFTKQGNGSFGNQSMQLSNFGGNADRAPFRTLIPRNKQRCRFINAKIEHSVGREKMTISGYSMKYESYSARPYKG